MVSVDGSIRRSAVEIKAGKALAKPLTLGELNRIRYSLSDRLFVRGGFGGALD